VTAIGAFLPTGISKSMARSLMAATNQEELNRNIESLNTIKALSLYRECSAEVQEAVSDMLDVLSSADADEDERVRAIHTIAELLFPTPHKGRYGIAMEDIDAEAASVDSSARDVARHLDEEEQNFAAALRKQMSAIDMTQAELAKRAGIGQPAIAMMLRRQCRPQQRTVEKLANAIGIAPSELWPASTLTRIKEDSILMSRKSRIGARDSKTGEFITINEANRRKSTTQKERIPLPGHGDTGRAKKK